jgi:hypothetical protein
VAAAIEPFVPVGVAQHVPAGVSTPAALARWLQSPAARETPAVREWVGFLYTQFAHFRTVFELFPRSNPNPARRGLKDDIAAATSPHEMLLIANQLYVLRTAGVAGSVLECGCFKGFSSCCLSIACRRLDFPLLIADSFEGLPHNPAETGDRHLYQPGDFAGPRPEVEANLRAYGAPGVVDLIPGWYSDTLSRWSRPLAALWLDVDLVSSVDDVLAPCLPHLGQHGVLFSHEFVAAMVADGEIVWNEGPAGAIRRHLEARRSSYAAAYLIHNLAIVTFPETPGARSHEVVLELLPALELVPPGRGARLAPRPLVSGLLKYLRGAR